MSFWRRLEVGHDLKLRPACPHTSVTYKLQRPRTRSLQALPGQVQIFLSSVLQLLVHMTNVSHNVTHCQELSDAGNDLRIHDLFYRLKPQGSEPCTDEDYMFGVWHSGA